MCVGRAAQRRDRRSVDNHAAAALDQHWNAILTEEEYPPDVDVKNALPVVFGTMENVSHGHAKPFVCRVADTGIVVENVDPTELLFGDSKNALDICRF